MVSYPSNYQTLREKNLAVQHWYFSTTCRVALLVVLAFFGVLYVTQISKASTQGYVMRDLQKQIQTLQQVNQKLEFEIASLSSMKSIQERLKNTDLVVADQMQYITLTGSAVALR
jgi:cell division protein FtsL